MSDEIKEIYLSNLEWTKIHDNIGGVMANLVFKNNMSYETYQKLFKNTYYVLCTKDYITNLQQENEKLLQENIVIKDVKYMVEETIYKSRVEKAIEYINKHKIEYIDKHFEDDNVMVEFNEYANPQALLELLQGGKDDNN